MASSKAATATITIHRGELAQIRSQIETQRGSKKPVKGQLYGLWTHSFQPVIQLVVALPQSSTANARNQRDEGSQYKDISDKYGLCLLGEWLVAKEGSAKQELPNFEQKRYVNVVFSLKDRELCITKSVVKRGGGHNNNEEGKLETLPGQSSFRLCENLIKKFNLKSAIDVSEEDRAAERGQVREAEVKEDQWYSTESGMEILKSLFQTLPKHFEVLETSRCTETHNIGFNLKYKMQQGWFGSTRPVDLRLEFPANFPKSKLTVFCEDKVLQVSLDGEDCQNPCEEFSQIICAKVMSTLDNYLKHGHQDKDGAAQNVNTPHMTQGEHDRQMVKPGYAETGNEETEKRKNGTGEKQNQQQHAQRTERKSTSQVSDETPTKVVQPTLESDTPETDDSSKIRETEIGRNLADTGRNGTIPAKGSRGDNTTEPHGGNSPDAQPDGGITSTQDGQEPVPMDTST